MLGGFPVIAVAEVYPTLLEMLTAATKNLQVGPAEENCPVGAVISRGQYQMILEEIDRGKAQAKLLVGGSAVDLDGGYYIEPTIFAEVPAASRLGQHEIFGPVLSVLRARDFDEAVALFNQSEYGLTGGLFSRSRKRIERAKRQFYVGNLYINRDITGARGRGPAFRRFQDVGVQRQGRRSRLCAALYGDEDGSRKDLSCQAQLGEGEKIWQ